MLGPEQQLRLQPMWIYSRFRRNRLGPPESGLPAAPAGLESTWRGRGPHLGTPLKLAPGLGRCVAPGSHLLPFGSWPLPLHLHPGLPANLAPRLQAAGWRLPAPEWLREPCPRWQNLGSFFRSSPGSGSRPPGAYGRSALSTDSSSARALGALPLRAP